MNFKEWLTCLKKAGPLRWVAGGFTLLYTLAQFLPCQTAARFHGELDDSWEQVLHWTWQTSAQFGRDIIFTFGPWGFLCGDYHPATFGVSVMAWTALALVFWWAAWRVAGHWAEREWMAAVWVLAFISVASVPAPLAFDIRMDAWMLLLLTIHFFIDERPTVLKCLLVTGAALWGLSKFTGLLLGVVVVGVIAVDEIFRRRRFPWLLLLFIGSVLAFWLVARQRLDLLFSFLVHGWRISAAYSRTMMISGESGGLFAGLFVFLAVLVFLQIGWAAGVKQRRWSLLPLGG